MKLERPAEGTLCEFFYEMALQFNWNCYDHDRGVIVNAVPPTVMPGLQPAFPVVEAAE